MEHGLHDPIRHNTWATAQMLAFCRALDEPTLNATAAGTFGTIMETLQHLVDAEASYLLQLSGAWPEYPWERDDSVGLDVLAERIDRLANVWERFLAGGVDSERLLEAHGDEGEVFAIPAGVFIAQALHHGSEHRAQICTMTGAMGLEPPDVSAWGYAYAAGRGMIKTPGAG